MELEEQVKSKEMLYFTGSYANPVNNTVPDTINAYGGFVPQQLIDRGFVHKESQYSYKYIVDKAFKLKLFGFANRSSTLYGFRFEKNGISDIQIYTNAVVEISAVPGDVVRFWSEDFRYGATYVYMVFQLEFV